MELSPLPVILLLVSLLPVAHAQAKPKPTLRSFPWSLINGEDTITLSCELQDWTGWEFFWYRNSHILSNVATDTNTFSVNVINAGETVYQCSARWRSDHRYYTELSDPVKITAKEKPKLTLKVNPQSSIYTGDTITLSCELQGTGWEFFWYRNSQLERNELRYSNTLSVRVDYAGETVYQCRASKKIYNIYNNYNYVYTRLSDSVTITAKERPKPVASINPDKQVFSGDTVTLRCEIQDESVSRWQYSWYKDASLSPVSSVQMYTISSVEVTHTGKYTCKGRESGGSRSSHLSDAVTLTVSVKPKPVASINPDKQVFSGDTVTLRCEIQDESVSRWQYSWYKDASLSPVSSVQMYRISSVEVTHTGKYTCKGRESGGSRSSHLSDAVTLTVSERPQAVLSVSPRNWLTEGDSVTRSCEVTDSSTHWTFSWYTVVPYRDGVTAIQNTQGFIVYVELLLDSSRGCGGSYTLSPSALHHTGVYVCRGKRGEPAFYTLYSNPQPLWISGESPPASLIISPSRTQHFTRDSLSLSCEDQSNSTGWTVRRYTDSEEVLDCSRWRLVTGSTCYIRFLSTSYTGVYWCESESGENSNPVNITVHGGDVILESPVHPVTEGHPLTLHCLYRNANPSNLRADFYKDGSVIQNQTTGEMIIHKVSKSDEGFYHCKHPERGESLRSWISVRRSVSISGSRPSGETVGVAVGLSLSFLFIILMILMILLWFYKLKKEKQQKSSQISEQNQRRSGAEDSQSGHKPLQTGEAAAQSSEDTYTQVMKKKKRSRKNGADAQLGMNDVTYAEVQLKPMKKVKRAQEKNRVGDDTVYSELDHNMK
ncbi:carcinoembryonic antigen-related cell adhesion molecule 5-like [Silurus meridionalis]|uniref:carcinoembryonic antigen-related cell adhesion molecule 5-like n=1 Tax=Silurus meridionalis TaxID=175797 RepID=UPI001EEAC773|nr:carcinoembryonic antigen-related cell adhesion molecule 5-like [Silurus meridionalis]